MGTLDTFLLRGDKDAQAQTAAFKDKYKDYGSTKNADGTKGNSVKFQKDVTGVLDNFFTGQEGAFNTAKGDMLGAVGQRRSAIESSVTPEMIAARKAAIDAGTGSSAESMFEQAKKAGIITNRNTFDQFGKTQGTFDAADLLSDADWNALAALEGLDGGRSGIQDQARGDYGVSYDTDAATNWIRDNTPTPPTPKNPAAPISGGADVEGDWKDTGAPEEAAVEGRDTTVDNLEDKWVFNRDPIVDYAKKNAPSLNPVKKLDKWKRKF
jgi:hypothetical protein